MATAALAQPELQSAAPPLLTKWTDHSAAIPLLETICDLQPIYDRLALLSLEGRAYEDAAATEIGSLTIRYSTAPLFGVRPDRHVSATGVCLTLWHQLEDIRDEWVRGQLSAEGLREDLARTRDAWHQRWFELQRDAISVAGAWGAFERGTL